MDRRASDLVRFYDALNRLEQALGGTRSLAECSSRMGWPRRGVYFFFEPGEQRRETGAGPRVVRVGTHALKAGSSSTLWGRLSQHRGRVRSGGGNHRGSIFRLLVGAALRARERKGDPGSWGVGGNVGEAAARLDVTRASVKEQELPLEREVSRHIRAMPFLWLSVDDPPGPESLRGMIERNSIALLSNYGRAPLDPPSPAWLGRHSDRPRVVRSGLWNNNHVEEACDPAFLSTLEEQVARAGG